MTWYARFEEPISVGRKKLATLQDAATFILQLKQPDDLWNKAGRCLIVSAENSGNVLLVQIARTAFMKALYRDETPISEARKELSE